MKFGRSKERKISRTPQDRIANIIFEKKNTTQARVKIGVKIILYLVTASFLGAIISGINVKNKYGEVMQQVKELSDNADNVILDYTKVINEVSPSLVTISDDEDKLNNNSYFDGNVTGIIIDDSGIILTNYSTIKGKSDIYVKLSSVASRPIKAQILIEDESIDLAVIKIEFDGELKPIKLADSNTIKEGQAIVV